MNKMNGYIKKKFFRDMNLLKEKLLQGSSQWMAKISAHKRKPQVLVSICHSGICITDQVTGEVLVENEVQKISFVAGDMADSRLFSFMCDAEGHYQIFNHKKNHQVETLVIGMKDLFQLLFKKRGEVCPKKKFNHCGGDMSTKKSKKSANKPKRTYGESSDPVFIKPPPFNVNAGRRQSLIASEQSTSVDLIDLFSSPPDSPVSPQAQHFQAIEWLTTDDGIN